MDQQENFSETTGGEEALLRDGPPPTKRFKTKDDDANSSSQHDRLLFTKQQALPCLNKYFGYTQFREGQWEIIDKLVNHQCDVMVLWATGRGKSLSYQLPALLTGKPTLVISPLISLMQDQTYQLNHCQTVTTSSTTPLAVCLTSNSSSSSNLQDEAAALRGDIPVVYSTPERILSILTSYEGSSIFPNFLSKLGCIAIDEAHCVSQWGMDFRPSYRKMGRSTWEKALRSSTTPSSMHSVTTRIPIVALTATATPRVQEDIQQCLQLHNTYLATQSLDRPNLQIHVIKKDSQPHATKQLLLQLIQQQQHNTASSIIVYASTRAQVEQYTRTLQESLVASNNDQNNNNPRVVDSYHAGMSDGERQRVHVEFRTGRLQVVVATVAFGMGIDKPDIRCIIHVSPPKTIEEYYQQIGRAGRDGILSNCYLLFTEHDFDRYRSDFYTRNLSSEAKAATLESLKSLQSFATNQQECRRKLLLQYFHQTPLPESCCGSTFYCCDVCHGKQMYGQDTQRNFGPLGARVVLAVIDSLREPSLSVIERVSGGNLVESYRYNPERGTPEHIGEKIASLKKDMDPNVPQSPKYFRELVTPLLQIGMVAQAAKKMTVNGYERNWSVYILTRAGKAALVDPSIPIILPVPDFVREAEKQERERRERIMSELSKKGLPKEKIPQKELEVGDGDVIRAYSKWYSYLDSARNAGNEDRLRKLESLLKDVEKWRSETAIKHSLAPVSVLSEHLLVSICYTTASLPSGVQMDRESLVTVGVRSKEVDRLVTVLASWTKTAQPRCSSESEKQSTSIIESMILGPTSLQKTYKWEFAVYKPNKKTGKATWEVSYERFSNGESPQAISMTPGEGKKPVQVKTVISHILDALVQGKDVNLQGLASFMAPPSRTEWESLRAAEVSTGMDVCADPKTSGRNGESFTMTDFIRPIVGALVVDTPFAERTEEQQALLGKWFDHVKWYLALRRCGYEPKFQPG